MGNLNLRNLVKIVFGTSLFFTANAFAEDLPFVSTLDTLQKAISGPFLLSASIIMIVVTCIMLAFGEWGDGFKKMINIVLWLSVAFAVTSFITSMFA